MHRRLGSLGRRMVFRFRRRSICGRFVAMVRSTSSSAWISSQKPAMTPEQARRASIWTVRTSRDSVIAPVRAVPHGSDGRCHRRLGAARCGVVRGFSEFDDDELLRATGRNPDAFGVFYERHVAAILAYLARATADRETALDLTAEVFAAALAASGRFRPGGTPARGWLFGIARNKLAESRRQGMRATAARRRLGIPSLSFADTALEEIESIIDAERAGHMERLATLSPAERDA